MPHPSYRRPHQLARERLLKLLEYVGGWPCPRCGRPMLPGMDLDLGHSDGAAKAAGFPGDRLEHQRCNRRSGGRLGAAVTNAAKQQAAERRGLRPRRRRKPSRRYVSIPTAPDGGYGPSRDW